jgi:hypothetical protein
MLIIKNDDEEDVFSEPNNDLRRDETLMKFEKRRQQFKPIINYGTLPNEIHIPLPLKWKGVI